EGWAVLGYLLNAAGKTEEGQAASRRATALEPDNWRHQYRLAYGSWGEERLRAVDRTLALMPGFAPARMLACMIFVARGTVDRAVDALDRLLTFSPSGPAGWIIPIDPMLAALREHPGEQALFAKLAARAA